MSRFIYCSIILIFILLSGPKITFAQGGFLQKVGKSNVPERGMVITGGLGFAGVKSDICGLPQCNNFGLAVSVGGLYKRSAYLGYGLNLGYARLGATEKDPNRPLNITFQSEVIDVTAIVALNLLDSYAGSGNYRSLRKRFIVPYIQGGGGIVYYTPTSFPGEGNLDDSQTTYDPERKYPAIAPVVSLGGGLRFRLSDEFSIVPELMYQITLTDYLDNIPSENNGTDHYGKAMIKVMYTPIQKNKILTRKY
jgi:hypothetical protein